jgi:hypothetical protein
VQAEVARLTEELTEARERLTADATEKDALAAELQMLRESALKDKGKRPVCLAPLIVTDQTHRKHPATSSF